MPPTCPGSPRACGPRDDGSVCHSEEAESTRQYPHRHCEERSDAAIQGFTAAPDQAAHLPWFATGLSALAMTVPFVIARRRSRRGNPGVYPRAWPGRPPALGRHGPVALVMTGNGTSLRGGEADAAIQGFTAAPGQAAHLPWVATGLRPSR
jgi:hypothetical protein